LLIAVKFSGHGKSIISCGESILNIPSGGKLQLCLKLPRG
jgi:hypothetical protein